MDYKELIGRAKCPDSISGCECVSSVYDYSCRQCREETMKDCVIAIESLLEKQQKEWISVKDRLPESDGLYLCSFCSPKYIKQNNKKLIGIFRYYYISKNPHFQLDDIYHVTHWMPLPEPPKMEE